MARRAGVKSARSIALTLPAGKGYLPPMFMSSAPQGARSVTRTRLRLAEGTSPNDEPILVENMRGWLLAEGLVMLAYVSENGHGDRLAPLCGAAWITGRYSITRESLQLPDADRDHSPGPNALPQPRWVRIHVR